MKGKNAKRRRGRRPRSAIWIIGGGVLMLGAAMAVALGAGRKPSTPLVPEVTGAPHLKFSPARVDLGDVKLGRQVEVDVNVTNSGDRPLRLSDIPWVEVVEGC